MLYGCAFAVTGCAALLYWLRFNKPSFGYWAAALASCAIACKWDFIPLGVFLIAICLWKAWPDWRRLVGVLSCSLAPLLLSVSQLFFSGLTLSDIQEWMKWIELNIHTPSNLYINTRHIGSFFDPVLFLGRLGFSCGAFLALLILMIASYGGVSFFLQAVRTGNKSRCVIAMLGLLTLVFAGFKYHIFSAFFMLWFSTFILNNLVACLLIFLAVFLGAEFLRLGVRCLKKRSEGCDDQINPDHSLLLVTLLLAILLAIRSFWYLNLYAYGPCLAPLAYTGLILVLVSWLPSVMPWLKNKVWTSVNITILTILSAGFLGYTGKAIDSKFKPPFLSPIGPLPVESVFIGDTLPMAYAYIESLHLKDQSVWFLPEGPVLSVLFKTLPSGYYFSLIPNFVETFGEARIIDEMRRVSPEIVVIDYSRYFDEYNHTFFGQSFGQRIVTYVEQDYQPIWHSARRINYTDMGGPKADLPEFGELVIYRKKSQDSK